MVNIFGREVTFFENVKSKEPMCNVTLLEALTDHGCEDMIDKYRETKKKGDKLALPVFTCSGIFSTKTNDGLDEHNGVICIDIDKEKNLDVINFRKIPTLMRQIPYVAYCGHSCGGEGYFVLMPIEDPEKHLQHYLSAIDDFERCGITVDKSCKNVSRLRSISYDNEAYFNFEAVEYSRVKKEVASNTKVDGLKKGKQSKAYRFKTNSSQERIEFEETKFRIELIIQMISKRKIDITKDYNDWKDIAAALANYFGEDGREYFHQISCFYPKYNKREADEKFESCAKLTQITIATFFHIAKKYDLYIW